MNKQEELISLLPDTVSPKTRLISDRLPCHDLEIKNQPMAYVLHQLKRRVWSENLYVKKNDLNKINRYKNTDGAYKNDFDAQQFSTWVKDIAENTVICDMENPLLGRGVFVPPEKKLPKGTFIASTGVIKLNPTQDELETKVHCSALQDLNSHNKKIMGLIDPDDTGGILDLINHAPDEEELVNFKFETPSIKMRVATSNLRSKIKFYNGYSIMGLEVLKDIDGGEKGTQLLWSYASPDEYLSQDIFKSNSQSILLFDNRCDHTGETLDVNDYHLKKISVFIDTGELTLQKIATLTRWEIMESLADSSLPLTTDELCLSARLVAIQASISYGMIQSYLKGNAQVERVIVDVPFFKLAK